MAAHRTSSFGTLLGNIAIGFGQQQQLFFPIHTPATNRALLCFRLKIPLCRIALISLPLGAHFIEADIADGTQLLDNYLETGRDVWDQFAPDNLQEHYAFPSLDDIQPFLAELQTEFATDSTAQLATYANTKEAIADWLEPLIDFLETPSEIEASEPVISHLPQFTRIYWDRVLASRKPPKRAEPCVPLFPSAFRQMGIPTDLVWISEVEFSMNPNAKSPVEALGPFQFMPETPERFGLSLESLDERTDPKKSALPLRRICESYTVNLTRGPSPSQPTTLEKAA